MACVNKTRKMAINSRRKRMATRLMSVLRQEGDVVWAQCLDVPIENWETKKERTLFVPYFWGSWDPSVSSAKCWQVFCHWVVETTMYSAVMCWWHQPILGMSHHGYEDLIIWTVLETGARSVTYRKTINLLHKELNSKEPPNQREVTQRNVAPQHGPQ